LFALNCTANPHHRIYAEELTVLFVFSLFCGSINSTAQKADENGRTCVSISRKPWFDFQLKPLKTKNKCSTKSLKAGVLV